MKACVDLYDNQIAQPYYLVRVRENKTKNKKNITMF